MWKSNTNSFILQHNLLKTVELQIPYIHVVLQYSKYGCISVQYKLNKTDLGNLFLIMSDDTNVFGFFLPNGRYVIIPC